MYKSIAACVFWLMACCAYANPWQGQVVEIKASVVSKTVLFTLSGELEQTARCNESGMFAIDLKKAGGEAVFDLLKYALSNGLHIRANGLNACHSYWKAENVKDIAVVSR